MKKENNMVYLIPIFIMIGMLIERGESNTALAPEDAVFFAKLSAVTLSEWMDAVLPLLGTTIFSIIALKAIHNLVISETIPYTALYVIGALATISEIVAIYQVVTAIWKLLH